MRPAQFSPTYCRRPATRLVLALALLLLPALSAGQVGPTRAAGQILYVNASAGGAGSGLSWDDAYTALQDALGAATTGDEIWVAAGTYKPTAGSDRSATFLLVEGMALYGGFAGGEDALAERDWTANVTTLSGDIGAPGDSGDNSYHVLYGSGLTGATRVDGFTIRDGYGDGAAWPDFAGAGFYCDGEGGGNVCSPTVRRVIFADNSADYGGALYNRGYGGGSSSPALTDVTFVDNHAVYEGGALFNNGYGGGESSPALTNVTFTGNSAGALGGAMVNFAYEGSSSPTLTGVTFTGNHSGGNGGAMFNDGYAGGESSPTLTGVTFRGNRAGKEGGAMHNHGFSGTSSPLLTNVLFAGNRAGVGGALYNDGRQGGESSPALTNVTFAGNSAAAYGGALYNGGDDGTSSPLLTNVILWANAAGTAGDAMANEAGTPAIAYSLVQGGVNGSGIYNHNGAATDAGHNLAGDPLFVTPVDPATAPTTAGNLALRPGSAAVGSGDGTLCPDADVRGVSRPQAGGCDIGAYERVSLLLTATLESSTTVSLTWTATGGPYAVWSSAHPYAAYTALVTGLTTSGTTMGQSGNVYFEVYDTPLGAVSNRVGRFTFPLQAGN